MLYFDTGFLAPLFKPERHSLQVEHFVAGLAVGRTSISHWTRVEFASLLAKNARMDLMPTTQAVVEREAFDLFVTRGCTILDVGRRDFDLARRLLSDYHSGL